MRIANWIPKDHSRISLKCALPHTHSEVGPKGMRQPCLFKLNDLNRQPRKMAVSGPLQELLDLYIMDKKYSPPLEHSIDYLSQTTANIIVDKVARFLGLNYLHTRKGNISP